MRLTVFAVCAAACLLYTAASSKPAIVPQPCTHAPVNSNWRCFLIAAPSDYARPRSGTVGLHVVVAPASHVKERRDPIFVLDGLGESVTEVAPLGLYASLADLARTHDLVFVDERGSSGIDKLTCPLPSHGDALAPYSMSFYATAHLRACSEAWKGKIDLAALSARTFASDIEFARKALHYDRIELVAYFYGTRIAVEYLRRFGAHAAAVAMTDVAPPQVPVIVSNAGLAAVELVVTACSGDAACHARYPDLAREYTEVRKQLAAKGLHAVIVHDGMAEEVTIPEHAVLSWLGARGLRVVTQSLVPPAIHALAQGDNAQIAVNILQSRKAAFERQPLALIVSAQCAEDVPLLNRNAGGASRELLSACRFWPHGRLGKDFRSFFSTPVPVLGVVAERSTEAPVRAVRALFSRFAKARLVIVPHRLRAVDTDWDVCLKPMITGFLDNPDPGLVDGHCVSALGSPHLMPKKTKAG